LNPYNMGTTQANGIRFTYLEQGEGELLLCLHGFPDSPMSFRHQMEYFSKRGYRVVAPFLRGYHPSEVPGGSYQTAVLAQDALELVCALGHKTGVLLGHDWGATIANAAAILEPTRVSRLITMAVPFGTMKRAFLADPEQQRRSWYIFLFQLPFAEQAVGLNDLAFIDRLWKDWSVVVGREELDFAKETLRYPGVLSAALSYYRHLMDPSKHDPLLVEKQKLLGAAKVPVRSLYLHGAQDGCIGVNLLNGMEEHFDAPLEKNVVEGAGHFLHIEKPREVNSIIEDFLKH